MVKLGLVCHLLQARTKFNFPNKSVLQWFPGHMGKGIKQMGQKLKSVDCVIEVHDSRIPISGRNSNFKGTVSGLKPHILVFNKKDLTDDVNQTLIEKKISNEGIHSIIFTNSKDQNCSGLRKIVPKIKDLVTKSNRYNRNENTEFCAMVIGVPNVGKSSLINAIRSKYLKKGSAAPVGALAGVTRSVTSRIKVCHDPLIYVFDTPGILTPKVNDLESGLKLALCSSMQDHLVGNVIIADYLLFSLNKCGNYSYVDYLELKEPSDNITEVLLFTALKLKKTLKMKSVNGGYIERPDLEFASIHFIKAFRNGQFGKVMLDDLDL